MSKRKYFSWTDEKRAELRVFIDTHKDLKIAFKEAAELFGVSLSSCYMAYKYKSKRPIVNEVDPEELEPRKNRFVEHKPKAESVSRSNNLSIGIHNDLNNECLLLKVNESVTVIKVKDILITIQNG